MGRLLFATFACLALPTLSRAVEPWADERLKVSDGMLLWIDGSRQDEAWQASGKRPLVTNGRIDVAFDGSGQGRHLRQHTADAMPSWVRAGDLGVIRFDGKDDHLLFAGPKLGHDELTIFLVAAPRSNAGLFRGFLAAAEAGRNDYLTGFNLDMSGEGSARFDRFNAEGVGFVGMRNLFASGVDFGTFPVLEVIMQSGQAGVKALRDGEPVGQRPREAATMRLDTLVLGARVYSNSADPTFISGHLHGDVAECLVYRRALTDEERKSVRAYLRGKYGDLARQLVSAAPGDGFLSERVKNPLAVQVFVPGFAACELSVDLPNVNNVAYRHDGKLVAVCYDGDIYLLTDANGDGLEDRATRFWENKGRLRSPIGMALLPAKHPDGDGVIVASKGKISLILDRDRDGMADEEKVIASGWKELPINVDALGVALAPDGSVYFGLGTADFTNAYLVDRATGKAAYTLRNEHGTVQRVSPDFQKRETFATGIRFPVGMAFNRAGDLFCTDQEGATWLPNGNPFDELLHVRRGRHYGFPPRHPRLLPDVIDEPSTFDYGPQHQSTCGMSFNKPVNGGPVFGPSRWAGDVLVTGYSRGKLYRTSLVKTPTGYVADTTLFANLNKLTVDCCVSPKGDLVVATHSGAPDWGTGPSGKGKLFKLRYAQPESPQPVRAWATGPHEVRVAFDRPLDPEQLRAVGKTASIEHGRNVRAGDRFEVLRPGYAVVQQETATPRFRLPVRSVQIAADRRTLILATDEHRRADHYAITLTGDNPFRRTAKGEVSQHAAVDLDYALNGVEASWNRGDPIVLPHPNVQASNSLTRGSSDHARWFQAIASAGEMKLRGQLDLARMLRPAVQPGSTIDYTLPPEQVTLHVRARGPMRFSSSSGDKNGEDRLDVTFTPEAGKWIPFEIMWRKSAGDAELDVTFSTKEDPTERPFALHRFILPWVRPQSGPVETVKRPHPALRGGDWRNGRALFHGEATCAKCHAVHGQGGKIGPDLTNLIHRDYDSVLRDVRDPSAALNPDHIGYTIELKSGRVLSGVPRSRGDQLLIGDQEGREALISRDDIESMTPSPVSAMPHGLDTMLGPEKMRDLLTFLLTHPLEPAPLELANAPPARPRSEVEAILRTRQPMPDGPRRKLNVVLAAGPKDHGPGEHDYPLWQRRWTQLLELAEGVTVSPAHNWPSARQLETADVIVFYSNNPAWSAGKAKELDAFLTRGGGVLFLHYAVDGHQDAESLAERIGLAWRGGFSKFRHGPLELTCDPKHPITRGFNKIQFVDESYWQLVGDPGRVNVLATGVEEGKPKPLLWTREAGKGRVFVSIPGHFNWTFDDPLFRVLLLRGIAWSAGEPPDRLLDLATLGARIGE